MRQFLLAKLSAINMLFEKANQEETINLGGEEALQIFMISLILTPLKFKKV